LAFELGRTVAELEATLSMPEWIEWLAWFRHKTGVGSAPASSSGWQSRMKTMRLISDLQGIKG
jgi:hypothetical protein